MTDRPADGHAPSPHPPAPDLRPGGFHNVVVAQAGPDVLVIRPSAGARLMGLVFVVLGLFAAVPTLAWGFAGGQAFHRSPRLAALSWVGLGLSPLLLGYGVFTIAYGGHRFRFDRAAGELAGGRGKPRPLCRLDQVVGVRVEGGGVHQIMGHAKPVATYRIDLILRNPLDQNSDLSKAFREVLAAHGLPLVMLPVLTDGDRVIAWGRFSERALRRRLAA